jgi:putative FmdB family regulatory protein
MARYDYLCRRCGRVELTLPMGAAAEEEGCPDCGGPARRVYTAPALGSGRSPLARAREAAARSAHEPAVVRRPLPGAPPPRRVARSTNPLHARLPRP